MFVVAGRRVISRSQWLPKWRGKTIWFDFKVACFHSFGPMKEDADHWMVALSENKRPEIELNRSQQQWNRWIHWQRHHFVRRSTPRRVYRPFNLNQWKLSVNRWAHWIFNLLKKILLFTFLLWSVVNEFDDLIWNLPPFLLQPRVKGRARLALSHAWADGRQFELGRLRTRADGRCDVRNWNGRKNCGRPIK